MLPLLIWPVIIEFSQLNICHVPSSSFCHLNFSAKKISSSEEKTFQNKKCVAQRVPKHYRTVIFCESFLTEPRKNVYGRKDQMCKHLVWKKKYFFFCLESLSVWFINAVKQYLPNVVFTCRHSAEWQEYTSQIPQKKILTLERLIMSFQKGMSL